MTVERTIIRRGTASDLPAIAGIQKATRESAQWTSESYLRYTLRVAEYQGNILGFVVSRQTASDEYEVLNVAVSTEHRRRGIASRLLKSLMNEAAGVYFLEVRESNEAARQLYQKLGFQEAGRRPQYYQNPAEAAIVMRIQSW
jgi:ribosomal-protein-alanine N-acetyltransferase